LGASFIVGCWAFLSTNFFFVIALLLLDADAPFRAYPGRWVFLSANFFLVIALLLLDADAPRLGHIHDA
jgi:hypothetical protein